MRWIDAYFPFTNPSYELEIYFKVLSLSFITGHCEYFLKALAIQSKES